MANELALGRAIREAVNGRNVMEFDERAAQAVHSFLGVEKGKELERDAVAKLVAALRGLLKAIDYQQKAARATDMKHAMAYEDLVRIEKDKAQVALRAAGEEVSDGG